MKIVLDDQDLHLKFAPLSLTRPIGDLRMGIFTNSQRWKVLLPEAKIYYRTQEYLSHKFKGSKQADLIVHAGLIPDENVFQAIIKLKDGEQLIYNERILATHHKAKKDIQYKGEAPLIIENRWDIFEKNHLAMAIDFNIATKGKKSQTLSSTNTLIGPINRLFIEPGAKIEAAIINTSTGPVYVGENAEIMEGSIIRGPLALCNDAQVKMGAKIYGPTTIGPHCKVGGEVNNVIFQSFSNKGHDGFLGNALIGEWCNLGADTNTSNLKNNYGKISAYSYQTQQMEPTGLQFMGLCMGDHSKCGINTMFNTATVVGVSSNIYGSGFPDKYIASFQWGEAGELVRFRFDKAIEYANNMMHRRGLSLSQEEITILQYIREHQL